MRATSRRSSYPGGERCPSRVPALFGRSCRGRIRQLDCWVREDATHRTALETGNEQGRRAPVTWTVPGVVSTILHGPAADPKPNICVSQYDLDDMAVRGRFGVKPCAHARCWHTIAWRPPSTPTTRHSESRRPEPARLARRRRYFGAAVLDCTSDRESVTSGSSGYRKCTSLTSENRPSRTARQRMA